jgi:hypothetical protein
MAANLTRSTHGWHSLNRLLLAVWTISTTYGADKNCTCMCKSFSGLGCWFQPILPKNLHVPIHFLSIQHAVYMVRIAWFGHFEPCTLRTVPMSSACARVSSLAAWLYFHNTPHEEYLVSTHLQEPARKFHSWELPHENLLARTHMFIYCPYLNKNVVKYIDLHSQGWSHEILRLHWSSLSHDLSWFRKLHSHDPSCEILTWVAEVAHDAVLTEVDLFSKMVHYIPTTSRATAVDIANLFVNFVWKSHGLPKKTISDRVWWI